MRSAARQWLVGVALAGAAGCTSIQNVSDEHAGARYAVGQSGTARVGEAMLDRYRYRAERLAQPLAAIPAAPGRLEVRAGTTLVGRQVDGELSFCTRLDGNFACFYDSNGDQIFDHFKVVNLSLASSKQALQPPVAYTLSDAPRSRGYKHELLYFGRSDAVIHLSYREYRDDLSQPAHEEDLHYTLNPTGPTEISFRSARLRVTQADNQTIQYEILAGLGE